MLSGGGILGLAITATPTAALILIPLLSLSIGAIALLSRGHVDIIMWLVTVASFLLPMNNVRLGANLTVGDGLIILALLLIIVIRADQRTLNVSGMDQLLVGILIVIFGGLLGSFFAVSTAASLAGLFRFGAATIAIPVLFGLWRPNLIQLRIIASSFVVGAAVSALAGILFIRIVGRAQGFTTHPNHLALASLMAVGLALGLTLSTPHRGHYLLLLGASALLSLGILSSGSRSGIIAEVVVVLVIAFLTRDRKIILGPVPRPQCWVSLSPRASLARVEDRRSDAYWAVEAPARVIGPALKHSSQRFTP